MGIHETDIKQSHLYTELMKDLQSQYEDYPKEDKDLVEDIMASIAQLQLNYILKGEKETDEMRLHIAAQIANIKSRVHRDILTSIEVTVSRVGSRFLSGLILASLQAL